MQLRIIPVILILTLLLLSAGCIQTEPGSLPSVPATPPANETVAEEHNEDPQLLTPEYTVQYFEKTAYIPSVSISQAAYLADRNDLVLDMDGNMQQYYTNLIETDFEKEFLSVFAETIQTAANQSGIPYVELVIRMVQEIPYDADAPLAIRSPSEVIIDQTGDCDEKALLAAALLSQGGYDTCLLLYKPIYHPVYSVGHATIGIAATRTSSLSSYRNYLQAEVTGRALIGDLSTKGNSQYMDGTPYVIQIGDGEKTYDVSSDLRDVTADLYRLHRNIDTMYAFLETENAWFETQYPNPSWSNEYINAYNDRVRHFNNIYEEYSKASDAAAKIQDQINDLDAVRTLLVQAG